MEQRVSVTNGKTPFILIAPNGANDKNTDLLTEIAASKLNSYAVVNWGWERSSKIDYLGGKADCNNIDHCRDIVYDEFLQPIIGFKNRILRDKNTVYQFIVQGVSGNDLPPEIDIIVGDGAPNNSCEEWIKKIFVYMANIEGLKTHVAKSGSTLAGSKKTNLNQYFGNTVQSMQLEIPLAVRKNIKSINVFTDILAKAINHLVNINKIQAQSILPSNYRPKIY
jgi:hypothetical protein